MPDFFLKTQPVDFAKNIYHVLIKQTGQFLSIAHTVKMVPEFPVSSRDVTNQTPPGQE